MRLNRGRGWETDEEGTSPSSSQLPKDVRLSFRHMGLSEYTGRVTKRSDSELCVIDQTPSYDEDKKGTEDGSRHVGLHHIWQSHPHAIRGVGDGVLDPSRNNFPRPWVPDGFETLDGKMVVKYRRINIEEATLPHDCANHLPE